MDSYNDLTPRCRGRLRPVRQRQDGAQGDARQVSRVDRHRVELRARQPDVAHRHQRRPARGPTATATGRPTATCRTRSTQDFGADGGDFCGVIGNLNFGTSTFSNTIDPEILHGWGVRPSDWNWGVSVQHEVLPRDVGRSRLLPPRVLRLRGDRQPGGDACRLHASSRSPRRRIRGCPTAAAIRSARSTT